MLNKSIQERIERIVNNEILTRQSSLVEKLLESEIVSYDEIVNLYVDNSDEIEEKKNEIEEIEQDEEYRQLDEKYYNDELTDENEIIKYDEFQNKIDELQNRIEELENEQEDPQEVYEWWVVSNWLADKLEVAGEPILKSDYETWWGRTCTGQAIKLDYVIEKIATNLYNEYGE